MDKDHNELNKSEIASRLETLELRVSQLETELHIEFLQQEPDSKPESVDKIECKRQRTRCIFNPESLQTSPSQHHGVTDRH